MKRGLMLYILVSSFEWIYCSLICESPWKSFHRNCILFEKEHKLNWFEAQKKCEDYGANLISINSFLEKKKLHLGLTKKGRITKPDELYWWVGLRLNMTEAKWVWADGDYLSNDATPWKPGEPDNRNGRELCADFDYTGALSDKDCNEVKPYICERIEITPPTTGTTKSFTITTSDTTTSKFVPKYSETTKTPTVQTADTTLISTTESELANIRTSTDSPDSMDEVTTTDCPVTQGTTTTRHVPVMPNTKTAIKTTTWSDEPNIADRERMTTKRPMNKMKPFNPKPYVECPAVHVYKIMWPLTRDSTTVRRQCPTGVGFASWTCKPPNGWIGQPDLSTCASSEIQRINKMIDSIVATDKIPTAEDVISIAANLTENIVSSRDMTAADISTSATILQQVVKGKTETVKETETILKELVKAGSYLFSKAEASDTIATEDKERVASDLLQVVETTTQIMVDTIKSSATITTKTENIYLSIKVFNVTCSLQDLEYNTEEDGTSFMIPFDALQKHQKDDGLIKAVFMTHYKLKIALRPHDDQGDVEVGSNVITASLGTDKMTPLSKPVVFTIQLSKTYGKAAQPLCSFWNFSKGDYGKWSQDGCSFIGRNSTHVTCECNHLTNFAILMDISGIKLNDEHTQFLKYITYIGCIISISCLALSWITFQCLRTLDSERNSIHKNLVFCLFAAELIFVVGIERTNNKVTCAAIALLLHFCFLSSFTWMFLEGIHIVILLKQVFDTAKPSMKYYYLVGYGIPITVVGTTAGIDYTAYGTSDFCWLTTEGWFIWSFTGPVAVILMINTSVLMYALSMVCRHSAYVFSREKSQQGNFRSWIQGAFAIEILLGSTWVFGYFFISEATVVMAYIFTVLNSLQGLFIFIFHCLLNKKIRFEYKKLAHVRHNSQSSTKSASFKKKEGSYEVYVSN